MVSFPALNIPVQRHFRDLQCPANLRDWVTGIVIERLGNTALPRSEGFWPTAYSPSLSGCHKASICSFPDQISLKLSESTKDMENELAPAGCGINVLCQAFKPNPPLLKLSHGSNQMRKRSAQAV